MAKKRLSAKELTKRAEKLLKTKGVHSSGVKRFEKLLVKAIKPDSK
jgi:hypothetical protein